MTLASKSIFDEAVREELLARASHLTPQNKPTFGKMNVNQMVVHCTGGIGMMIGKNGMKKKNCKNGKMKKKKMVMTTSGQTKKKTKFRQLIPIKN